MNKYLERLLNGLWKENPVLILMLGTCPALAVSTKADTGTSSPYMPLVGFRIWLM